MTQREDFIGYVMRYGGRCRDCADADGTCPTSGLPCDPNIVRPIVAKTIDALRYGVENGFINNPFLPREQTEGGGE